MPKALHLVPIIENNNNNDLLLSSSWSLLYERKGPCWEKWRWRNVVSGTILDFPKFFIQKEFNKRERWRRSSEAGRKALAGRAALGGAALGGVVLLCPYGQSQSRHRATTIRILPGRGLLKGVGQDIRERDDFEVFRWVGGDVDSGWGGPGERKLLGFNIRATRTNLYTNRRTPPLPCAVWAQLSLHAAACSWFLFPYSVCPSKREKDKTHHLHRKGLVNYAINENQISFPTVIWF